MNGLIALVCLGLLTVTAGMFLLAKTRNEGLGKFFKTTAYIVIVFGFLSFGASLVHLFCPMHKQHGGKGCCGPEMHCAAQGGHGHGGEMPACCVKK